MRKKTFVISILLTVVSLSQIIFAQNSQKGLFWGGNTNILLINGKGKIDEDNFNITNSFTFSEDKELGWGWENRFLYGFKPIFGYRISPNISVFCAYNLYLKKHSDKLIKNYNQQNENYESIGTPRFEMDYNQNSIQFFSQYYPFSNKGLFLLAGIEYVYLKAKYEITYSDNSLYDRRSGFMHLEYSDEGNDNTFGFILGGGIEIKSPLKNFSLLASAYYSLTNYKGDKLFIFGKPSEYTETAVDETKKFNPTVNSSSDIELGIGGFGANLGIRMYLQDVVEKTKKDTLRTFISLGCGISKALGDGSEYWNIGFCGNANLFYPIHDNILIGGRVAYNRWGVNDDKVMSELKSIFPSDNNIGGISGSIEHIEISPSIRIITSQKNNQKTRIFGQIGLGYYIMEGELNYDYSFEDWSGYTITKKGEVFIKMSEKKFGLNFGGGIIINSFNKIKFELYPIYNIIFTEEESTKYFTFNFGIIL